MNDAIKKIGIIGAMLALGLFGTSNSSALGQAASQNAAEVENLKVNGEIRGEKAGFVITGDFKPRKPEEKKEKPKPKPKAKSQKTQAQPVAELVEEA